MNNVGLQRYKRLLLANLEELSSKKAAAASLAPAARGIFDEAIVDAEADLYIRLHESDLFLIRAIEGALARIAHQSFGVRGVQFSNLQSASGGSAIDTAVPRLRAARAVSRLSVWLLCSRTVIYITVQSFISCDCVTGLHDLKVAQ